MRSKLDIQAPCRAVPESAAQSRAAVSQSTGLGVDLPVEPCATAKEQPRRGFTGFEPGRAVQVPAALADVALIDAQTCAASAGISVSKFYDEVRAGKAPEPVFRRPRCSRWRVSDVRAWLIALGTTSTGADNRSTVLRASKAGTLAAERRKAKRDAADTAASDGTGGVSK